MTLFLNVAPSHARNKPPQNQSEPNLPQPNGALVQRGPTPPPRGLLIKQAEANPRFISPAVSEKEPDAETYEEPPSIPVYAAINRTKSKRLMLIVTTQTGSINLLLFLKSLSKVRLK